MARGEGGVRHCQVLQDMNVQGYKSPSIQVGRSMSARHNKELGIAPGGSFEEAMVADWAAA